VDVQPIAESFPERYRRVLDRVADLEAAGRHPEADRVRRDVIRAYSGAWTVKSANRIDLLAGRADHLLRTPPPARTRRHRSGVATLALVALRAPRRTVARMRADRRGPVAIAFTPEQPTV
jgi:hypothetical protein